ncbi:MAG: hypothetical protein KF864_10340 [Phycisphaeraceae bacterium]|nr:hypothetical protein [Phycisphaeraceae bacterium]
MAFDAAGGFLAAAAGEGLAFAAGVVAFFFAGLPLAAFFCAGADFDLGAAEARAGFAAPPERLADFFLEGAFFDTARTCLALFAL